MLLVAHTNTQHQITWCSK